MDGPSCGVGWSKSQGHLRAFLLVTAAQALRQKRAGAAPDTSELGAAYLSCS